MSPEALRALLREAHTIAVVGLSPKAQRPSHVVARYLRDAGYRIVPVNPGDDAVAGISRSEEHTSELQSRLHLVCRLLLEKKKKTTIANKHAQTHSP